MAYTPVTTIADGDAAYTAAYINTYIRDNWLAGLPDLFAAKGDLVSASAADIGVKLAKGTNGYFLLTSAGQIAWGIHPTKDPVTTKGDLITGTADNTAARLAVGPNTSRLQADSAQTGGMKWVNNGAARASAGTGDAYNANVWTVLINDTENFDVASALTVTPNESTIFVVPVTGYYFVSAYLLDTSALYSSGTTISLAVYSSSTQLSVLSEITRMAAGTHADSANGSDILYLTAGNSITIQVYPSVTGLTSANTGVSFIRLGV